MLEAVVLDHLVITVTDVEASCTFYSQVLGMRVESFGTGRKALHFGKQKINLHAASAPIRPHAARPTPGSADLCFVTDTPLTDVLAHLEAIGIAVELGPVERRGVLGRLLSLYIRDPDGNLIEIANNRRSADD